MRRFAYPFAYPSAYPSAYLSAYPFAYLFAYPSAYPSAYPFAHRRRNYADTTAVAISIDLVHPASSRLYPKRTSCKWKRWRDLSRLAQ